MLPDDVSDDDDTHSYDEISFVLFVVRSRSGFEPHGSQHTIQFNSLVMHACMQEDHHSGAAGSVDTHYIQYIYA